MATFETRLADGTVDTSAAALYTEKPVGNKLTTTTKSLLFFNTNAATQTVLVYHRDSQGNNTQIARLVLAQNEKGVLEEMDIPYLGVGEAIWAETTTASAVNFFLSGNSERRVANTA